MLMSLLGEKASGAPMPGTFFSKGGYELVEEEEQRITVGLRGRFSRFRSSKPSREAAAQTQPVDAVETPEQIQTVR